MSGDVELTLRGPQAYALARKALDAMEKHRVWPTPLNFELWVRYVAGPKDSKLAAEIDQILKAGEPFSDSIADQLAAQYLPKARLNGEILDAGDALSKELDSVSKAVESARESSEAYGQQLAAASKSLDGNDNKSMKDMVDTLTTATRRVQEENHSLESQLADTTAEVSRLREHLEVVRRDAMTDALTNLANRKAFDEALEKACADAADTGESLTLAVIDIDHFKSFNDTWGHQTGDQVIRYVASVIGRAANTPRFAARFGGEEFAIIFPGEDAQAAMLVMEDVREEVASRILKRRSTNEDLGAVTVSTGLAELQAGELVPAFLERADSALYASKRGGRNMTTCAQYPAAAPAAA